MSVINGDNQGNLLISYIFKSTEFDEQLNEEKKIKTEIANFLSSKGYKFIIADDDLINEKLLKD